MLGKHPKKTYHKAYYQDVPILFTTRQVILHIITNKKRTCSQKNITNHAIRNRMNFINIQLPQHNVLHQHPYKPPRDEEKS